MGLICLAYKPTFPKIFIDSNTWLALRIFSSSTLEELILTPLFLEKMEAFNLEVVLSFGF